MGTVSVILNQIIGSDNVIYMRNYLPKLKKFVPNHTNGQAEILHGILLRFGLNSITITELNMTYPLHHTYLKRYMILEKTILLLFNMLAIDDLGKKLPNFIHGFT